jgi:hypothetical protein
LFETVFRAARPALLCLSAGLILCLPAAAQKEKLPANIELQNPGFEELRKGYSEGSFERFRDLIDTDNKVSHGGNVSLRIGSERGSENPWVAQSVANLEAGAVYLFRAWVRTDPENKGSLAALKVEFYNAQGRNTSGLYQRLQPPANGQWVAIELPARADPDTVRATLLLRLFGPGRIWFDDLELQKVAAAPPLTLMPERQAILPNADPAFKLSLRLLPTPKDDSLPAVKFDLTAAGGKTVPLEANLKPTAPGAFEASLALPAAKPGEYIIGARLEGNDHVAVARVFVPLEKRKPKFLSDDGAILVDGQPVLPVGIYHVGTADYPELARRGFNCVQGIATTELTQFGQSLDAAGSSRLWVDVPLYAGAQVGRNLQNSLAKLKQFHRHPAVLNWKIIDEPDIRPEIMDEVPGVYAALKEVDPDHPLLLTLCQPDQYAYWVNFADIVQIDPYPIPDKPLTMVSDMAREVRKHMQPWQNLTVVLQAGWIADPMNQPTFAQARAMLYLALISGAKGIFWYSFRDPGWELSRTPLWERFREINEETTRLSAPILRGTRVEGIDVEADANLRWTARAVDGRVYVLLANPVQKPITATITLPQEGKLSLLSGEKVELKDGKVTLEIAGPGADTLILETGAAAVAPVPVASPVPTNPEAPPAAPALQPTPAAPGGNP